MVSAARSDGVERVAGQGVDLAVDARRTRRCVAVQTRPSAWSSSSGRARWRTPSASSAATMMCFGATMSMQWASDGAGQVGVDQRRDAADAGDAEPDRHVFRPVRHQQADRLALGEILRQRPARVAVGALGERAIAEASRGRRSAPARRRNASASSSITTGKPASDSWRSASSSSARARRPAEDDVALQAA